MTIPDTSNGYEARADDFRRSRSATIGVAEVRTWAVALRRGATVLDLGCGPGLPISDVLVQQGCDVYGVDASPRMIAAFTARFPDAHAICEPVEESAFFNLTFDGIVAWGLMFLLPIDAQRQVIAKAARALTAAGSFLFTSPRQVCSWNDALTGLLSTSLGADAYRDLLEGEGLTLVREFEDAGDNHYYLAVKP